MQTRKLYYEDPFQKGFASTVVSCEETKGGYAVVLEDGVRSGDRIVVDGMQKIGEGSKVVW